MGKLINLELKHIFKDKSVIIVLIIALVIAISSSVGIALSVDSYHYDNNGVKINNSAFSGLHETRANEKEMVLTEEKLSEICNLYNNTLKEHDGEISNEVFYEKIAPYKSIIYGLFYTFLPHDHTGLYDNSSGSLNFYDNWKNAAQNSAKKVFNENSKAYKLIEENIEKVHTPFVFKSFSGWEDATAFLGFFAWLIIFLCCIITAPIFSANYRNHSDNVYRCTKNGRTKLAATKIISIYIVNSLIYIISMAVYTILNLTILGKDGWNVSAQLIYADSSSPFSLKQVYLSLLLFGFIAVLGITAITLFFSSITTSSMHVVVFSIVILLLPWLLNSFQGIPNYLHFILDLLPSNIVNLYNEIIRGLGFFSFGNDHAIWVPYLLLIGSVFSVFALTFLTIFCYSKHQGKR